MSSDDIGDKPEPEAVQGTPNPGGVDSITGASADGVERADAMVADLDPDQNPAVEDALPDEMRQGEDTDTKATRDGDDGAPEEETPA